MDPVGFALENYDAVGRWRSFVDGEAVDALAGWFDAPPLALDEAVDAAVALHRAGLVHGDFAPWNTGRLGAERIADHYVDLALRTLTEDHR